jgi:hypothetical protein
MVIQEGSVRVQATMYSTPNPAVLMTVLETKKGKEEHIMEEPPETPFWETEVTEILRHHRPPILETPLERTVGTEAITTVLATPSSSTKRPSTSSPPPPKKSPSFAAFDHGDHIHVIFSVRHTNNASRHINTILNFLRASFEGTSEAHTTLQLIRFPTRFISYLIRKGLRTFYKYGAKLIPILRPLTAALMNYDTTDLPSSSSTAHCEQYVEDKKALKKETITQRTFSIDFISKLITDHKITSYESFQRTLPTDVKIQLLKQLGYGGENIIKTLIKIQTVESLQTIKTKHFYQIMIDNFSLSQVKEANVAWLATLFRANNINIDDFFAKFLAVHSMNVTKIKSLVLEGPTNTGKSLLINILLSDTKPTRIARERDKSNFHLDQLPNSTSVVFEEPIIDQTTVGTWKLLLEGGAHPHGHEARGQRADQSPTHLHHHQPATVELGRQRRCPSHQTKNIRFSSDCIDIELRQQGQSPSPTPPHRYQTRCIRPPSPSLPIHPRFLHDPACLSSHCRLL